MSALKYKQFIAKDYPNKNGILVSIFSQPFPLGRGSEKELTKSMYEDQYGCRSDIDAKYLKDLFKEECFKPFQIEVGLHNQMGKDEIKKYIHALSEETAKYDMFIFVFLTYLSYENTDSVIYRDERIHLYDGLCHMDEIYDEVKKVDGMQLKPKIFFIQADDVSLLRKKQYIKGEEIIKPMKIPQDADRLVIMSDIPQRVANPDMDVTEKHPSFMIKAFGEALYENINRQPEERQDLLTLTPVINNKVRQRIEELKKIGKDRKEEMYKRAEDMYAPLVTSTLTKLTEVRIMGLIKQSVVFCVILVMLSLLKSYFEPKLPVVFDGYYHPSFKNVADKFKSNLESGKERGGALAVYHKRRLVLDLWGGYADVEAQRPWQKDTMTIGFSNTKGVAAIIVASLVEKGYISYKSPVADYWPEFAQNDKQNITVEMLLSHQAGLPVLDEPISFYDIKDNPAKVERILAAQRPIWPAGSTHGYHTLTYGPYVDTLIKKVDPKGRTIEKIFQEDIATPFDIDLFMNVPRGLYYRTARVYEDPAWKILMTAATSPVYGPLFFNYFTQPDTVVSRSGRAVKEFAKGASFHNNPYIREIPLSCCHSTGTARGYAKLYGILGNNGVEGQRRLLTEDSIRKLSTPLVSGMDITLGRNSTFGPGTFLKQNPRGELMFGHTGYGGQVAMVDPKNSLGIAYLTNFISMYGTGDDPRYIDLEEELYKSLDNYIMQEG